MTNQEQIAVQRNYYNRLASDFDQKFERENANHLYKIQEIGSIFSTHIFNKNNKAAILEIGGGTGIHAFHFLITHASSLASFTINDLSEEMLKVAEKRLATFENLISYNCSAAEEITTDKTYNGIYISGSMHHFSDPSVAILKISKLLAPGGVIIICEPVVKNPLNFIKAAIKKEEWGQFIVTRKFVEKNLDKNKLKVIENRLLHYKSDNRIIQTLFPYQKFEQIKLFNSMAVMFLIAAKKT